MITAQDLNAAIAECQGERNPNANTCIKLAAYYTLQREMNGGQSYSYAAETGRNNYAISLNTGTEFAKAVEGRSPDEIMPIMDEAMTLLQTIFPRCYDAIMRKL